MSSEDPGGSCLHQQLGGGEEVTTPGVAPSDEVGLTNDDVTIFNININKTSYDDVVLVGVGAAAMIISALLQLREVFQEPDLGILRH